MQIQPKKGIRYPKVSDAKKGHKMPLVTRLAIRKANIGSHRNGWKWSNEQKKNLIGFHNRKSGNPMWKGGISTYERKLYLNNRRRAMRNNAKGSHTEGEWLNLKAQYNWTCPSCERQEPEIKLTEDHIIPLIKGGSDNIENIQPLCRSCNCKKHTHIIKY